jgi:hypothetical protein
VLRYAGFETPESVFYDEVRDRYLVSNINGSPTGADNNGFISELSPDGEVKRARFIEAGAGAGAQKVALDAPKGLAVVKNVLYVADLTRVRLFDVVTGAPQGEVAISGSAFLNDVVAAPDGKVYVSDSGLKLGASGFEATGTDAIYVIEGKRARALAKGTALLRPNGLAWTADGVLSVPFGGNKLLRVDAQGAVTEVASLPKGQLDGLVLAGSEWLVSSWESSSIYRATPPAKAGEPWAFSVVFDGLEAPADIGFDSKRRRVLVPRFKGNVVEVYALP